MTREQRVWGIAYLGALLCPLVLMVASPYTAEATTVFAIAVGFAAYVGMVLQVVSASRVPQLSRSVGIAPLLRVHRYMGIALVGAVTLHVLVFFVFSPWSRSWLWPIHGPLVAQAGTGAFVAMLAIGATSVWRVRMGIDYDRWRMVHVALTAIAMLGAYVHVLYASDYSWSTPIRWLSFAGFVVAAAAMVYLRVGRAFGALGSSLVLASVRPELGDATTLVLEGDRRAACRPTAPGQFAWLKFHGRAYSFVEHPFSIASPAQADTLEFTVKASGDTTRQLRSLLPGTTVLVDGPHGGVQLAPGTTGWLLVVAGIGITPAISVIRTTIGQAAQRPVPLQLVYGVRDWSDATFAQELAGYHDQGLIDLHVVASAAAPEWTGMRGRIDARLLAAVLPADRAARTALVCGPGTFADTVVEALVTLGVPARNVHAERFTSV